MCVIDNRKNDRERKRKTLIHIVLTVCDFIVPYADHQPGDRALALARVSLQINDRNKFSCIVNYYFFINARIYRSFAELYDLFIFNSRMLATKY